MKLPLKEVADAISNIVIGIVYFAVIAVSFFVSYKVVFREGSLIGRAMGAVNVFFNRVGAVIKRFVGEGLGYVKGFLNDIFTKKENDKEDEQ